MNQPATTGRRLDTILLKVASRCNMDCSYCYVYHMGDEGWREQPKLMSPAVVESVAASLRTQLERQGDPFNIVLHGGEPLMLGVERLSDLCRTLRNALSASCGIHVQTNGILLSDPIIDVLVEFGVGVSVSIDGPAAVHDRFRKDHRQQATHARVVAGIERLQRRDDARPLFAGVLAVVDPASKPSEVYSCLKETGAPGLDFLVRDGNWDSLPFGKASADSTEYGEWLSGLMAEYLADPAPPRVRILDDMLRLLLGGKSYKEGVGETDYGILVVEPDGRISKNDTLKVAHASADRFERPWSILRDELSGVLASASFEDYWRQQRPTSSLCKMCPDLAICGGGMVAHRWSAKRGFDNPTVFCADQRLLIANMRNAIRLADGDAA
ncbi:cyclophane-forming radical SAM/SPASM peptide maturase YhhB [Mesorhizobium dulcispinae]|uniref:cyclophane-forming radical SAM/SPASM peptide maturase YhhB n=1 Tax=Mesorhizobium dulcispinae TaxID=3072316 RepID=UPI002A249806|nr:cyclophane-forming radical SAM/SPASM peptide maturase YhhB [Mesorhizobium sp. VK23D]MDX8522069.1 cyclophane-forming radical SAM/SPASM peptide maturase YhhB [Mesorhizobium sp. VK23D]